ncbi:DUF4350 domain-containing protein [Paenibacillus sp. y28]|uniref:DUF4350 domain-containing protein n=1 Tax=Paenibacillus sp. y28 TaxID=3129110 RepID=UPI00301AD067
MLQERKRLISLAVCLILFFGIGSILVRPKPVEYPPYVSFSPGKEGVKALTELIASEQQPLGTWKQPWRFLPKGSGQLLVVIQPWSVHEKEEEALLEWMEQGNEVLWFDSGPTGLNLVETKPLESEKRGLTSIWEEGAAQDTGKQGLVEARYRLAEEDADRVLLSDDRGVLAAEYEIGDGRLTVYLTPHWLTNSQILQYDHFDFIWPKFAERRWNAVWMDEVHHGIQEDPGLMAVYPRWLILACVQAGLALWLWLWLKGKRLGPVLTPRAWIVRRGDESLLAVSGWYQRKRLMGEALMYQKRYLRQLIQDRWGVPLAAPAEHVLEAASARWSAAQVEQLRDLLARLMWVEQLQDNPSARQPYSMKQAIEDSTRMEQMNRKLEKEG